jgi:hypothetical protein
MVEGLIRNSRDIGSGIAVRKRGYSGALDICHPAMTSADDIG